MGTLSQGSFTSSHKAELTVALPSITGSFTCPREQSLRQVEDEGPTSPLCSLPSGHEGSLVSPDKDNMHALPYSEFSQ